MIIALEIDDVLADTHWRQELLPDWHAFHEASQNDIPSSYMIRLINALHLHNAVKVWIVTSRPESWRQLTNHWLLKHNIMIDELFMRPKDNFKPAPEFKLDFYKDIPDVLLIIEHRDDVCNALRGANHRVAQV